MLTKERLRHLEGVVRRALSAPGAIVGAGVLSQEAVRAISREMDGIRLLAPPSVPGFAYLEVAHDDDAFDIGVFLMPAGAAFPYHDHPGMTVFTRVLAGSVRIRNLDWVDGAPAVDANGYHARASSSPAAPTSTNADAQAPDRQVRRPERCDPGRVAADDRPDAVVGQRARDHRVCPLGDPRRDRPAVRRVGRA